MPADNKLVVWMVGMECFALASMCSLIKHLYSRKLTDRADRKIVSPIVLLSDPISNMAVPKPILRYKTILDALHMSFILTGSFMVILSRWV